MSTRQRSFFDQNSKVCGLHCCWHLSYELVIQPRRHWQKNRKPDDVRRRDDTYNKPTMAAPPIAASAGTKSKLKAFHFAENFQKPATGDECKAKSDPSDKENQATVSGHTSAPGSQVDASVHPSTQKSTSKYRKDCPQTPLSRLPLADLIGSTEDPLNRAGVDITPDERVYWNHSPHSSDQMSSSATPAARRGKKRARSSSPASASQNEVSSHFASKKDLDLDPLQKALKTPQADPAIDLWNRYAINAGNLPTQNGPPLPAFAHLIDSPSPHSAANALLAKNGNALRRSLSGGFEFGTSKAKRRRINSAAVSGKGDDVFRDSGQDERDRQERSKISRVSSLVERIQETLLKARNVTGVTAPSSSSPLPERGADNMIPPWSPLRKALLEDQAVAADYTSETVVAESLHCDAIQGYTAVPPESMDTSSEYDDDDIDLDLLRDAENPPETSFATATIGPRLDTAAVEPRKPASLTEGGSEVGEAAGASYVGVGNLEEISEGALNPNNEHDEFDEFDDHNNEQFAADLEDVVAMYDIQASTECKRMEAFLGSRDCPQAPAQASAQDPAMEGSTDLSGVAQVINDVEVVSDDEFGDDIDFEQLAVEFTATQGPQTVTPSHSAVRTRSFDPSI